MKARLMQPSFWFALAVAAFLLWQSGIWNRFRYPTPSLETAKSDLIQQKAVLVDVREADEIAAGMLEGALWIPLSEIRAGGEALEKRLVTLPAGKELFLYCRSGNRSSQAAAALEKRGYAVRNLGAYDSLRQSGFTAK